MISGYLQEGWVKFFRYYCVKGYIDVWIGDSINNPNNKEKQQLNLNSLSTYFRLNDGQWFDKSDRSVGTFGFEPLLHNLKDWNTAEEIWNTFK